MALKISRRAGESIVFTSRSDGRILCEITIPDNWEVAVPVLIEADRSVQVDRREVYNERHDLPQSPKRVLGDAFKAANVPKCRHLVHRLLNYGWQLKPLLNAFETWQALPEAERVHPSQFARWLELGPPNKPVDQQLQQRRAA